MPYKDEKGLINKKEADIRIWPNSENFETVQIKDDRCPEKKLSHDLQKITGNPVASFSGGSGTKVSHDGLSKVPLIRKIYHFHFVVLNC